MSDKDIEAPDAPQGAWDMERLKYYPGALAEELAQWLEWAIGEIQWMSGSPSFGPEGEAHEGWLKVREKLFRAMAFLQACRDIGAMEVREADPPRCPLCRQPLEKKLGTYWRIEGRYLPRQGFVGGKPIEGPCPICGQEVPVPMERDSKGADVEETGLQG